MERFEKDALERFEKDALDREFGVDRGPFCERREAHSLATP